MSHRPAYFFIPGIETNTEDVRGWQLRAARWVDHVLGVTADSISYRVKWFNRWRRQSKVVADTYYCLCDLLGDPRQEPAIGPHPWSELVIGSHSNGGDAAARLLRDNPAAHCKALHLVAAAADADFELNGLNLVAARRQVGNIYVWVSPDDTVLRDWATLSTRLFGWAGLGYGSLGYVGPKNMSAEAAAITRVIRRPGFGHSDYFNDRNFADTMRTITGAA